MGTLLRKANYYITLFQLIVASIYCIFFEEDIRIATTLWTITIVCAVVCIYHKIQSYKAANSADYSGAFYRSLKSAFSSDKFSQLRFEDAIHYINTKHIKKALKILNFLTSKCETPQSLCVILTCIGLAYLQNEDYKKALEYYNKALSYDARSSFTWVSLGNLHLKLHDFNAAIEAYSNSILYDSKNYDAYTHLASLYFANFLETKDTKHLHQTIAHANAAIEINSKLHTPYELLYLAYFFLDDNETANKYKEMSKKLKTGKWLPKQ